MTAAEQACEEMSDRLHRANQEQQSRDMKTAAELDDLYRTKINLEERLIELIRYGSDGDMCHHGPGRWSLLTGCSHWRALSDITV